MVLASYYNGQQLHVKGLVQLPLHASLCMDGENMQTQRLGVGNLAL